MSPPELCSRLRVYVVIDPKVCLLNPVETCRATLAGGATAIQLRCKHSTDLETLRLAQSMRSLTTSSGALFIVNDRVDIALASAADGVHLGVDDLPLLAARAIAGERLIIGFSPEHDDQSKNAAGLGADYLGIGPVFETTSKEDAGPAIGVETLLRRRAASGLPVIGIGGIHRANAMKVVEAGACGVAVMSAIIAANSPEQATREIAAQVAVGLRGSL